MEINSQNLRMAGRGFKTSFQGGLKEASTDHLRIATRVPSSTKAEEYGWLGKVPNVREWLGDRVVQNLKVHDYTIKNRDFELTIGVDRNDFDDDNLGLYSPLFEEMGNSTGAFPCQLVFDLMKAGFTTICYDGQYFFDTDHPVLDKDGVTVNSVANTDGGAGAPWFLIDTSRALKPILWQVRKDFTFVAKDNPDDDNVFDKKEFKYGVDGRMNVGFGFWQFAWGSKQPLDAVHFKAAVAALTNMKGDHGRPLGLGKKLLLVVDGTNEEAANNLVVSATGAAGATNPWKGRAEVLVTPWLA